MAATLRQLQCESEAAARAEAAGLSYEDLASWCESAARLAEAAGGPARAILAPFVGRDDDAADPTYAELAEARAAFLALPEAERRRVFNGWGTSDRIEPTGRLLGVGGTGLYEAAAGIMVEGRGEGSAAAQAVDLAWPAGSLADVVLLVRQGVTREAAAAALRAAAELLERAGGLVAADPSLVAELEAGRLVLTDVEGAGACENEESGTGLILTPSLGGIAGADKAGVAALAVAG